MIGLALVTGVAAARHFTRPISELIAGARAIADGDFERPIRVDTGDELEDLGQQFRGMAARLKAQQQALSDARQRAERKAQESQGLSQIATEMLGLLTLPQILQLVADKARELMQADLAFLGLHEGEEGLRLAAISGAADALTPGLGASLADVPCAERTCQRARCPILVSTSCGSHATAPLRSGDRVLGYLCVGFRIGRADRTETPEALAGLASQAAIAIERARLHEDMRRLERLEERDRIAADLHDGIIQAIYATGLGLEECRRLADAAPAAVAPKLDKAVERLNLVIRDVRNYVVGLQPERLQARGLSHALRELVRELELNALLATALDVDPAADSRLTPEQTRHLFHIAREALTNIVKHAAPAKAALALRCSDSRVWLRVEDDGIGFDPGRRGRSGRGLQNMVDRTRRLGGTLTIGGGPGRGACITVDIATGGAA
jgi:signal transduction histidine kinase/HAMP domain-containing protein